ncbi:CDP-alcohol phosphatidyltransferase family protein [Candidatus Bathyarchaeota archaeon]|nr:CDP-alcohol phosphatidyltransferase family protein [Candidatus Bathyarchaeota archaeon]
MLTKLKQRVQLFLNTEAAALNSLGLTPNHVSVLGLIFAITSAITYYFWRIHPFFLILAPLFMLISGLFDALDGAIARIYRKETKFGGFFDSLLDRYSDAVILCGITIGGLTELQWGLFALMGSLLVSYARARAEAVGVKMESIGVAERPERIILIAVASFLSYIWIDILNWSIIILVILTNLTVVQRAIYFRKMNK